MKRITRIGIGLIIFGAIALTYHGISYTTREKVLQTAGGIVLLVDKCLQLRYGVGKL